jgi:hypothetical protein
MNNEIPTADKFIVMNTHLTNAEMLRKFAKLHVRAALEETYKVSKLDIWDKDKIYECYPQSNIK